MTETAFKPTPADPEALKLVVVPLGDGQYSIENGPGALRGEFNKYYVHLSGYCGAHDPAVFAAAPELLEALVECTRVLFDRIPHLGPEGPDTAAQQAEYEQVGGAWSVATRAIAKARGGAA